jgi:hypothetical protein
MLGDCAGGDGAYRVGVNCIIASVSTQLFTQVSSLSRAAALPIFWDHRPPPLEDGDSFVHSGDLERDDSSRRHMRLVPRAGSHTAVSHAYVLNLHINIMTNSQCHASRRTHVCFTSRVNDKQHLKRRSEHPFACCWCSVFVLCATNGAILSHSPVSHSPSKLSLKKTIAA